jgi:hypothetical protein
VAKTKKTTLSEMIFLRLAPEDVELLNKACALAPVLPKATVARQGLRAGLQAILSDPRLIMGSSANTRSRSPATKRNSRGGA